MDGYPYTHILVIFVEFIGAVETYIYKNTKKGYFA